jgi:hypothetical protein
MITEPNTKTRKLESMKGTVEKEGSFNLAKLDTFSFFAFKRKAAGRAKTNISTIDAEKITSPEKNGKSFFEITISRKTADTKRGVDRALLFFTGVQHSLFGYYQIGR